MTRKGIEKFVDGIIAEAAAALGLNTEIEVKGGEAEATHALTYLALKSRRQEIIDAVIGAGVATGLQVTVGAAPKVAETPESTEGAAEAA